MTSEASRETLPIVVVGAGAAGCTAALFAARAGRRVVLLERTRDGGRKILISGGGRCNVLPSRLDPAEYFTDSSPNALRRILRSWPLEGQRRFFEEDLGVALVLEPESGKLFPASNRARDVRDALLGAVRDAGARVWTEASVEDILPPAGTDPWTLVLGSGAQVEAAAVVFATGGLSVPQTGSDGTGMRLVQRLGHSLNPTYPALTPLTAEPPPHAALAGVSLRATLAAPRPRGRFTTEGGFLFTHRGYSGPAVLNVSHFAVRSRLGGEAPQPILVQWTALDAEAWESTLREGSATPVAARIRRELPDRLADALLAEAGVDPQRPLGQLRREERLRLTELLARYPLPWTGDEGYKKAEVTGGGVPLSEVDPRTLGSRVRPGLFLCGEILDAFGPIGGYNFAWAWATGRAAGLGAAALPAPEP